MRTHRILFAVFSILLPTLLFPTLLTAQQFKRPIAYATGDLAPNGVAVGDLNGDGRLDVVVSNTDLAGSVAVLLGSGNGTFQAAVTYPAAAYPQFLLLADFNKDGNLDVAVVNRAIGTPGQVNILLGNGDGTFQPAVAYGPFVDAFSIAVGDFNRDGILDLAVADTASGSMLLGNGNGTFRAGLSIGGTNVDGFAVADFNHDQNLDLAIACNSCSQVQFFAGNGHGAFTLQSSYAVPTPPIALATKDFNGDGTPDVAVAGEAVNNVGSNMTVLESSPAGFVAKIFPFGDEPRSIATADFNRDGRADIVTANEFNGTVDVFVNAGRGVFLNPKILPDGAPTAGYVAVGDLNGDGKPDLIVTDGLNAVRVLLQR